MADAGAPACSLPLARFAAPLLASFTRRFELAVALGEDRELAAGELVRRRHVPDRRVKAHAVVVRDELRDDAPSLVDGVGRLRRRA